MSLKWSDPAPPTEGVSYYNHCYVETPIGRFTLEWKSWKGRKTWNFPFEAEISDASDGATCNGPDGSFICEYDLEKAKRAVELHLEKVAREILAQLEEA